MMGTPSPFDRDDAAPSVRDKMLGAALAYAALGWPVFPIRGGTKCPKTKHGLLDATQDEARIRAWWAEWPYANIGIRTGAASGIVALDVDCKAGADGEQTLARLIAEHGALPETARQTTPSGGKHYLFADAPGVRNSVGKLGPGLDVRAEGGYILAAPSLVVLDGQGARYAWERSPSSTPLAPMPEWLLKLVTADWALPRAAVGHGEASQRRARADGIIPEGQRNSTLASVAGRLRRRGLDEQAILQMLSTTEHSIRKWLSQRRLPRVSTAIQNSPPVVIEISPHPPVHCVASAGRTRPAFSFSLRR